MLQVILVILLSVSGHSIWIHLDSFVDRSFDCDKDNIYIPYVIVFQVHNVHTSLSITEQIKKYHKPYKKCTYEIIVRFFFLVMERFIKPLDKKICLIHQAIMLNIAKYGAHTQKKKNLFYSKA